MVTMPWNSLPSLDLQTEETKQALLTMNTVVGACIYHCVCYQLLPAFEGGTYMHDLMQSQSIVLYMHCMYST